MDQSDSPAPDSVTTAGEDAAVDGGRGNDVFDVQRLRQIVELMERHQLSEIDLQQGSDRIKLGRGSLTMAAPVAVAAPAAAPPPTVAGTAAPAPPADHSPATQAGTTTIDSPMVGTFYSKANPQSPPLVKVGDTVTEDTVVCIIEAMKVFNEIPAEVRGEVVEVLVADAQSVDFGKPLFRIRSAG